VQVNLGAGDRYVAGWRNVDHAGSPHRRDETVDLRGPLPWPTASITHAYLGHVLEHLTLDACQRLLAQLLHRMVPGGCVMVVGPDVPRAQAMAEAGTLDVTMESLICGGHRWDGDEHQWECCPEVVAHLLASTGWLGVTVVDINEVPDMWPVADRRPQWQFGVAAHRPAPPTEEPE
jgi:hypothetical protein